jgi:2-dehydro-3-deoxyphosphogluconate aldolase/(4S)-4-hydroxy-2-oxoglutarate aldolase
MFPDSLLSRLHRSGVIAVLTIDDLDTAVPLAKALLAGGVDAMELTLRTPTALDALRRIHREVPDLLLGAGTILSPSQAVEAKSAGAAFGVAPGCNPRVVTEANRIGLPIAPGVCTPSDVEAAVELGCRALKFFPAEQSGGLPFLRALSAPFGHLGVRFIPLGGISPDNAETYLVEPSVLALGGSWLAPRDLIRSRDWAGLTSLAREAADLVNRARAS